MFFLPLHLARWTIVEETLACEMPILFDSLQTFAKPTENRRLVGNVLWRTLSQSQSVIPESNHGSSHICCAAGGWHKVLLISKYSRPRLFFGARIESTFMSVETVSHPEPRISCLHSTLPHDQIIPQKLAFVRGIQAPVPHGARQFDFRFIPCLIVAEIASSH